MSRRGLQLALVGVGAVATTFGALGVLQGGRGVLRGGTVSANVDSEMRFFASWYAVLGILVLRAARRPESEATIVRACAAGFLLAACGRVLSMRALGPPSPFFKVLMGLEFAVPVVIVPWQLAIRRPAERCVATTSSPSQSDRVARRSSRGTRPGVRCGPSTA